MRVTAQKSNERQLQLDATLDELVSLYDALMPHKRSKLEAAILEDLALALLNSDEDLKATVLNREQST